MLQTRATNDPPQTAPLPHMREWESLTYEEPFSDDFLIVSFHSRISKEEVEKHVPDGWYCPPTWEERDGIRNPNPIKRWDDKFVWLLLRKRKG